MISSPGLRSSALAATVSAMVPLVVGVQCRVPVRAASRCANVPVASPGPRNPEATCLPTACAHSAPIQGSARGMKAMILLR